MLLKDASDDFSSDDIEDDVSDESLEQENIVEEAQDDRYMTESQPTHPQLLYNTIYHNKGNVNQCISMYFFLFVIYS